MSDRDLLKQALEALERGAVRFEAPIFYTQAIAALRAALEQPNADYERGFVDGMSEQAKRSAQPPRREWKELPDEQIDALAWFLVAELTGIRGLPGQQRLVVLGHLDFARAIERALKEKNQ